MFWDAKKMEEERKRKEEERTRKISEEAARAKAAKKQKALDLKKKQEKEQRWREEEEAEAAKEKQENADDSGNAATKRQAPVLNRGFGFGGSSYQNFNQKQQSGTGHRPGIFRPNIPGLEGREQSGQPKGRAPGSGAEPASSGTAAASQASVSLRRPI
jgi:hypothetical protein